MWTTDPAVCQLTLLHEIVLLANQIRRKHTPPKVLRPSQHGRVELQTRTPISQHGRADQSTRGVRTFTHHGREDSSNNHQATNVLHQ